MCAYFALTAVFAGETAMATLMDYFNRVSRVGITFAIYVLSTTPMVVCVYIMTLLYTVLD